MSQGSGREQVPHLHVSLHSGPQLIGHGPPTRQIYQFKCSPHPETLSQTHADSVLAMFKHPVDRPSDPLD